MDRTLTTRLLKYKGKSKAHYRDPREEPNDSKNIHAHWTNASIPVNTSTLVARTTPYAKRALQIALASAARGQQSSKALQAPRAGLTHRHPEHNFCTDRCAKRAVQKGQAGKQADGPRNDGGSSQRCPYSEADTHSTQLDPM